jgi:hypothetical protein
MLRGCLTQACMKTTARLTAAVVLCAFSFWLGRFSISRQVIVYSSAGGFPAAFPRSDPTYGLPIAFYTAVLSEFRGTNSDKALGDLEAMLDGLVERAEYRRPLLEGWRLEQFDKTLSRAARYRAKYPRPLSQGTGFYWTADRQSEVDRFLKDFNR